MIVLYGTVYPVKKEYRKQHNWIREQVARGYLLASGLWREALSYNMGSKSGVREGGRSGPRRWHEQAFEGTKG